MTTFKCVYTATAIIYAGLFIQEFVVFNLYWMILLMAWPVQARIIFMLWTALDSALILAIVTTVVVTIKHIYYQGIYMCCHYADNVSK